MPAYNAEGTIRSAVITTLRAMPTDAQLIVLDDKSTDDTLAVLSTISDKRLRIIEGRVNVGGGNARNRLLREADSEFVASMDADDLTLPWRFSVQMRSLQSVDVVFSSAIRFGERARRTRLSSPLPLTSAEFPAALLFHCPVWQSSLAARRSVVEEVGGYQPMRFAQDYDLWLRIALAGARMCRLALPVFAYRQSSTQVTQTPGYIDVVRSDERLRTSYCALFNSRENSVQLDLRQLSLDENLGVLRMGLTRQLSAFRAPNRVHYAQILKTNRIRTPLTI